MEALQDTLSILNQLKWFKITIRLENTRKNSQQKAHPLAIFHGMIKYIHGEAKFTDPDHVLFHVPNRASGHLVLRERAHYDIEILFFLQEQAVVEHWRNHAIQYFLTKGRNFRLDTISDVICVDFATILAQKQATFVPTTELCLEFLTPFQFKVPHGQRLALSRTVFILELERRLHRLFNQEILYQPAKNELFDLITCYLKYVEIYYQPKSQPNGRLYLNGAVGKLFLKGDFTHLMPLIWLAEQVHIGGKLGFGMGYFRLVHGQATTIFEPHFPDVRGLEKTIHELIETHDDMLLDLKKRQIDLDATELAEQLAERIQLGYQPQPHATFQLEKKQGGVRFIEKLAVDDLIIERTVYDLLLPHWNQVFRPEVIGFRPGLGREQAIQRIQSYYEAGLQHVLKADIASFFDSVDLQKLKALIHFYLPEQDVKIRTLLLSSLESSYLSEHGMLMRRLQGLAQGSPLSPLLANLYLHALDQKLAEAEIKFIRYADDLVLFGSSRHHLERYQAILENTLATLSLQLHPEKIAFFDLNQEGITFLGLSFAPHLAAMKKTGLQVELPVKKPVYITQPGMSLRVNHETVEIYANQKIVDFIPIHRISEIAILAQITFSTRLVQLCERHHVAINFSLGSGYQFSSLRTNHKAFYDAISHQAMFYANLSILEKISIAKNFAIYKIKNYVSFFRKMGHPVPHYFFEQIARILDQIELSATPDEVRGHEGHAAKLCFAQLNQAIPDPAFHFHTRQRTHPDYLNSLLNFGYYLLFSRLNSLVQNAQLNPYLGFLHSPNNQYQSLVCDIQELFRAHIDQFILKLLHLKLIQASDFMETKQGYRLQPDARRRFIFEFEKMLELHSSNRALSLNDAMQAQIYILKKYLSGEDNLLSFYTWEEQSL